MIDGLCMALPALSTAPYAAWSAVSGCSRMLIIEVSSLVPAEAPPGRGIAAMKDPATVTAAYLSTLRRGSSRWLIGTASFGSSSTDCTRAGRFVVAARGADQASPRVRAKSHRDSRSTVLTQALTDC